MKVATGTLPDSRWLVIGGAGFIGGHLVDQLLGHHATVMVIDNFSMGRYRNPEAKYTKADVRDARKLRRLIEAGDFDVIVGAWATRLLKSLEDPRLAHEVNGRGVLNVLEALVQTDSWYIHLSTGSVYGYGARGLNHENGPTVPSSTYGVSKLAGESYVRVYSDIYGVKAVTLRLHSVYGPRQDTTRYGGVVAIFINRILHGRPPIVFGDGNDSRPFLYVHDAVQAIFTASSTSQANSLAINIAGEKSYSINYLANLISKLMDSKIRPIHKAMDRPSVRHFHSSMRLAQEVLGYRQRVDLRTGIRLTIAEKQLHKSND